MKNPTHVVEIDEGTPSAWIFELDVLPVVEK